MKKEPRKISFDGQLNQDRMTRISELCKMMSMSASDLAGSMGLSVGRARQYASHMEQMGWLESSTRSDLTKAYESTGHFKAAPHFPRRIFTMHDPDLEQKLRKVPVKPAQRDWAVAALFGSVEGGAKQ